MSESRFLRIPAPLLSLALLLALGGCGDNANIADKKPKGGAKTPAPHLVELATVRRGHLAYAAERPGSLRALRQVKIVNQDEGQLLELSVREGDRVQAGQVLARYDDRIVQAQLAKALAHEAQAAAEAERAQSLVGEKFLSAEGQVRANTALAVARAEVQLQRALLQNRTLRSPMDGVVTQRLAHPGDATARFTHLLTLIDPAQLVTDVSVSELVLPRLRVGGAASVRIDALGDKPHRGRILRIHPTLDATTRSGVVEVVLEAPPAGARPGQFCRVSFDSAGQAQTLIPLPALQRDAAGEFAFVYQADSTVRRVAVKSGLRLADQVEILSGLEPEAQVVVRGFLELSAGRKVQATQNTPAAQSGAVH